MIERGSVVLVRLEPTEGQEQAGTRPAVVVSAMALNERSNLLVVAPVTSKKIDRVFPFEALLNHETCGLKLPSKAMLNQTRAISKGRILSVYGRADAVTMKAIERAILITFDVL